MSYLVHCVKRIYLSHFSQPAHERVLYREIRKRRATRILEFGIGTAARANRMIEAARLASPQCRVCYTAVDLFELRDRGARMPGFEPLPGVSQAGISLKLAHCRLRATGARVRLVPGDPYSALARTANALGVQHLIVISADQDRDSLSRAWFYVPRLLEETTQVFVEVRSDGGLVLESLDRAKVNELAGTATRRRAA